jgi:very-short-patch-repair endonuclease
MNWTPRPGETWRKNNRRALSRARGLRANETESERVLWKMLRSLKQYGAHFRRQANVGPYVFDFATLKQKLLIELDGGVHNADDVKARDLVRQNWAEGAGYRVLRLKNEDLEMGEERVLATVRLALHAPHPCPSPKGEGF